MPRTSLCGVCSLIDFSKHIYGDNGLRYHIRTVDLGQLGSIQERSARTGCVVCLTILKNFSQDANGSERDASFSLQTASVCQCAYDFSAEHNEFTTCRHPRRLVFKMEARHISHSVTFQVCLLNSNTSHQHDGFLTDTDPRCSAGRHFSSTADLKLFRNWLTLCKRHHTQKCTTSPSPQPKLLMVIDVKRRCIVPAPPNSDFVALSYVWGPSNTKRLTRQNHHNLIDKEGALKEAETPATVWDAIQVTEALGQRYCWIDALCNYQDDVALQQDQISQMEAIYSRAVVTIVAAAGDAATGLCGIRPDSRAVQQDIIPLGDFTLIRVADPDVNESYSSTHSQIVSGWHRRAWTYQEGLFSRRMLIFKEKQIYWHCRSVTWLEEMILETAGNENEPMSLTNTQSLFNSTVKIPKSLDDVDPPNECRNRLTAMNYDEKLYYLYSLLLQGYITRQLSFRSDTLNAFANVTRALTLLNQEEFIWGLPKSTFNWALTWMTVPPLGWSRSDTHLQNILLPDGAIQRLPFPTWSWASCGCGIPAGIPRDYFGSPREPGLIVFYSCLINGKITRITPEKKAAREITSTNNEGLSQEWLGKPRHIQQHHDTIDPKEMIHSGTLKFWTSVATIYMLREQQRSRGPRRMAFLSAGGKQLKVSPSLETQTYTTLDDPRIPEKLQGSIPNLLKNYEGNPLEGDYDLSVLNLIIVDRVILQGTGTLTGRTGSGHLLYALEVEWNNEVALREGCISLPEEDWVSLEDRKWKLVTLR